MTAKRKTAFLMIVLAAAVLLAVVPMDGGVLGLLALPFTLVGDGLRALSLSGGTGNAAAIVLYVLLCLSPLALKGKRKWRREDGLLLLAVGVMFYVLYGMINPGMMPAILRNDAGEVILSGGVYSVLVSWGVLKLLRASEQVRQEQIYGALRIFLLICAGELAAVGLGLEFRTFVTEIQEIRAANTWPGLNLIPTYTFLFLSYLATAAEYLLDAAVLLMGARLLKALERDAYSEECLSAANWTALWCRRSLMIVTMSNLALNLGQVFLASVLRSIDITLRVPVLSLAIAFGTLALVRLLGQGKALKEDNDLFI